MRIIDADTLKEAVSKSPLIDFDDYDIFEVIDNAPTITIKEWVEEMPIYIKDAMLEALRPRGEWIKDNDTGLIGCSCCHIVWLRGNTKFCPNCGADMRGDKT